MLKQMKGKRGGGMSFVEVEALMAEAIEYCVKRRAVPGSSGVRDDRVPSGARRPGTRSNESERERRQRC